LKNIDVKSTDPVPPTHYLHAHPFNQVEAKIKETTTIPHQTAKSLKSSATNPKIKRVWRPQNVIINMNAEGEHP